MANFNHKPVMLEECMDGLKLKDNGLYFDGTLGGAGHSYEILKRTSPNGKLVATDRDIDAINASEERLKEFEGRFTLFNTNYKNFKKIQEENNFEKFDGILLDLGVSSYQLDNRERGFSYMAREAPLDMRMDKRQAITAEIVVNEYSEKDLTRIFFEYGEEKFTNRIVRKILEMRALKRITTTGELVDIVCSAIPRKFQQDGPPARKVFQAIRIEVNEELTELKECIEDMVRGLKKGGRICIMTFHSLEDRIVKNVFKYLELDCICDKHMPICICDKVKEIDIINKKPIIATEEELLINSRSKSAKLRIAERII